MKILFLLPYPLKESPSQRFRFEQYFQSLTNQGHAFTIQSFLSSNNWQLFFRTGNPLNKAFALFNGFLKRIYALLIAPSFHLIFIHREVAPIGPPIFEWILAKIFLKKIIYDFDDAIWLADGLDEPSLFKLLKWRHKVKAICSWSYKVSCGNQYLQQYAKQFNNQVYYNPTTIDCEHWHNPVLYKFSKEAGQIVIGWTGSHSTLKYLNVLEPILKKILIQFPMVSIVVIADQQPFINLDRLNFIKWNPYSEIEDLLKLDIGIMPLPDDEWAKGKCGFKALQYLALKIPAVVSPVGVNPSVIENGVNGYLASNNQEWENNLIKLISDSELRTRMGVAGRQKVIKSYSVSSNTSNFLSLFE